MSSGSPRARFFSIRLRILAFAGLALVFATAAFTWLALRQLDERQGTKLVEQRVRSIELASRLFQQQSARLQSLGTLVADLPGVRAALRSRDPALLARVFDPFWSDLNLTHGLDRVAFFGPDGSGLAEWGMADIGAHAPELAHTAAREETPQYWLECNVKCLYTTAVPLVEGGHTVGAIVMAAGLQDMVLDFRRLSGVELAVINLSAEQAGSNRARINTVLSVSGGKTYEDLVHALPEQIKLGQAAAKIAVNNQPETVQAFEMTRDGRHYRLYSFAAPAPGSGTVKFLAINDATAEWREMDDAVRGSMALGALILVLGIGLLYVLLRSTMNRLRQAMTALPLLGEGRYDEARAAFQLPPEHLPPGRLSFRDEVDDLANLTYALANTLEQLHAESRQHAASLRAQATQLEHERDFITGLLDTAPVLILTYGLDGRIRLANAHAVKSCGRGDSTLLGQPFASLFLNVYPAQAQAHVAMLNRIKPGEVPHSEGSFSRTDGVFHDVIWFHSCLEENNGEHLFLSVGLDVTDYRTVERNLRLLSEHDSVTGLYNRRAFKRELDGLLSAGGHGVLMLFDIDEFKSVNESGGHEAGDSVLTECARYIQNMQPHPHLAGRLGADDFALVLGDLSSAEAIVLARALNHGLVGIHAAANLENAAGMRARITSCVGLVVFPEHGGNADALLANAEIALAQARAKGHASWHLYTLDDPYREAAGRRTYWREEVERGLDNGAFLMHFQPIQHILSGRISHYEALIRLQGQDGKLIPPGMFIDVAESTGLIRRIDRWVIETVVAFVAQQAPEIKVALNLSSRSFDDDVAFETMQAALARHNVTGERLLLEITETAALANLSSAIRIMGKLRGLGCAFGLDDFGVGYSSFQYLKELPFDFVKIDGSFVKGLTQRPDDVVFVKALNDAVKGYGKSTIAEFVEDEATLSILREIGVDYAQGYLIGRPNPELLKTPS